MAPTKIAVSQELTYENPNCNVFTLLTESPLEDNTGRTQHDGMGMVLDSSKSSEGAEVKNIHVKKEEEDNLSVP